MSQPNVNASDRCPGCSGPITYSPADPDGITVYFHCPNVDCKWGKP